MKFKHHFNEQNMAHFILGDECPKTPAFIFSPPTPTLLWLNLFYPPPLTLFTDWLTTRVLNKNEVRKWFEGYTTCWMATQIFCDGVTKKKKRKYTTEEKGRDIELWDGVCARGKFLHEPQMHSILFRWTSFQCNVLNALSPLAISETGRVTEGNRSGPFWEVVMVLREKPILRVWWSY